MYNYKRSLFLAKFKIYFDLLLVVFFVYLFINVEVLFWLYFSPDGFWGYIWFFAISVIVLVFSMGIWNYIERSIMLRRLERINFKNILLFGFFPLLGAILYSGTPIIIMKSLNDRYKYIKQSEKYFSEGKFSEAVEYAEVVTEKALSKEKIAKFLFIPYLFINSEYGTQRSHIKLYQAFINYAFCLQSQGKQIYKAEEYFLKSKDLAIKYFQNDPEFKIIPLMGLAKIYMAKGNLNKSEECYLEVLPLLSKLDKDDVESVTITLIYYSEFAFKNGDIDKAAEYRRQALKIYETVNKGKENIEHLSLMLIVASDYLNTNIQKAEELVNRSREIAKRKKDNLIYITYLKVNARLQELKGNKQEAENILNEIIEQVKNRQGDEHTEFAQSLYSLGSFYLRYSEYSKANELINQALLKLQDIAAYNQHEFYTFLLGSAVANFNINNQQDALHKVHLVEEFLLDQLEIKFSLLTNEGRETYIASVERYFSLINSLYIRTNDSIHLSRLYNNILATKSIALQSNRQLNSYVQASGNIDLILRYRHLSERKEELSKLQASGAINTLFISSIRDSVILAESEFLKQLTISEHYQGFKLTSVSWLDIQKALKPNEVAIEYINTPSSLNQMDDRQYSALLVTPKCKSPILIHLFNESDINKILSQDGFAKERIEKVYSDNSISLLNKYIWEPIKDYIKDSSIVYVSLSGILHQVAFPVFTINERCNIVYLSSTRQLASDKVELKSSTNLRASLFGGIDYNGDNPDSSYNKEDEIGLYKDGVRGYIRKLQFQYLPNTLIEIKNISSLLSDKGYYCTPLSRNKATKEAFIQLENEKPAIIHVATHGFYFPVSQDFRSSDLVFGQDAKWVANQNPLFRSGLLFAGANRKINFGLSNDGVLTAFEISKLDLSSVDMVVLSACETGLGDLKGGEGVYGLQRALKLAGVNSIVISLWEVPDSSTSLLMREFYKAYLDCDSKQKALKIAQKKIREDFPNPYYWAAFTIVE